MRRLPVSFSAWGGAHSTWLAIWRCVLALAVVAGTTLSASSLGRDAGAIAVVPAASEKLPATRAASKLPPEKVREYDRIFFNEMEVWNKNSQDHDFRSRERLFREMARDGYEVAGVALEIFKPTRGVVVTSLPAYEKLRSLADAGNASAMCFLPFAYAKMDRDKIPYRFEDEVKYVERGARMGHPNCRYAIATFYGGGGWGYPRDLEKALAMIREVALEGYYVAHVSMFNDYRTDERRFSDLVIVRRALCWGRLAEQHTNWALFDHYLNDLRAAARAAGRDDLFALGISWDQRIAPTGPRSVTAKDCIAVEQEN